MDSSPSRYTAQDPPKTLLALHVRRLRDGSGLPDAVLAERRYRSITDAGELRRLGSRQRGLTVPGLLILLWGPDGGGGRYAYRPDVPLSVVEGPKKADALDIFVRATPTSMAFRYPPCDVAHRCVAEGR